MNQWQQCMDQLIIKWNRLEVLKKFFASVVNSQPKNQEAILGLKKATTLKGEPIVLLNEEEIQKLCSPLRFALIGSFS